MFGRKGKVIEDVGEEKQHYRGCERGKAKLLRMFWRKTKSQRMYERKRKVIEDVREEKQIDRGC